MKEYTKYLTGLILLIAIAVSSCEKFLDQAPAGEETKEYIFEDYLRSLRYIDVLYRNRISVFSDGNRLSNTSRGGFLESATDMAEYTANYGVANKSFNIGNWYESEVTPIEVNRWANSYNNIRRCYMFFENMHMFSNDPQDYLSDGRRRKETMIGEVHYMIAWYYNELMKRYGGVPIITKTLTIDEDFRIPRSTYDETKEFILAHLDTALTILPDEWGGEDHGRATKSMVMAFKSRVLLYAASPQNNPTNDLARWTDAANAARDLIDYVETPSSPGFGMHELQANYQNLFMRSVSPDNVKEIIEPAKRSSYTFNFNDELVRNNQASPGLPFQAFGSNGPTQNFVDRFEVLVKDGSGNVIGTEKFDWNNPDHVGDSLYKNRDPRFYYTVLYNNVFWISRHIEVWRDGTNYGADINPKDHLYTHTGYYLKKYWPKELQSNFIPGSSTISGWYSRYAEILLNYAEAMNEVFGPDADGLGRSTTLTSREAINRIRARLVCPASADIDPVNISGDYYPVLVERNSNPDFPVLPAGLPPITSDPTKDEFRERIKNERTLELCFEDQYWYDLLRWKDGEEHIGGTIYGIDVVKSGSNFIYTRKVVEERYFDPNRMYRYPIPTKEIQVMGIEQNPGW
ncbi:MAG: RagB/SusD family nutrient uptake outer membrane protein [Bacteroidales bacterium]|nr:RagB/SusD family nutrient uptake outer membrane protein [Bacteroidales bacterium]